MKRILLSVVLALTLLAGVAHSIPARADGFGDGINFGPAYEWTPNTDYGLGGIIILLGAYPDDPNVWQFIIVWAPTFCFGGC